MKKLVYVVLAAVILIMSGCGFFMGNNWAIKSPDGNIEVEFSLNKDNQPVYDVTYKGKQVIGDSKLGIEFIQGEPLAKNFKTIDVQRKNHNEKWEMQWGEQHYVVNNYNELKVEFCQENKIKRKVSVEFRVFNDGLGFRYLFPEQQNWDTAYIKDEHTEFKLTEDNNTWWIPGHWDSYEQLYSNTKFSKIDVSKFVQDKHDSISIPVNAVNTPVTMKTKDGVYLSFHEANLTNYSGMTLAVDKKNMKFVSNLVGGKYDYKVKRALPFNTPWRTIQIANRAGALIESKLIVNLNEPNKLGDVSWFKPTKYMGIWWEMHLGKSAWDLKSGKHGATTKNAKSFIDFASEHGIGALLVEGWNIGWETWSGFDFVTPYPDYDLEEVVEYGKRKGVDIIMHHETGANVLNYENHLDTAYALCEKLGIHTVKSGYVGKIVPEGEFHHGQYMVNHYRKVLETAAKHKVAVNAHEPIKATGIRRTYPNAIAREGLVGQEYNAWGRVCNPVDHLTIIPFTRMLAGPVDYTPGVFDIKFDKYKDKNQVNTTLAHQLALYVVIYSPVQMACDLVENYEGQSAFQFITDVAVNWDTTLVLDSEIGDFVTTVRKERDGDRWFLGAITDENSRTIKVDLDFLDDDKTYKANLYLDGENAHWDKNPLDIDITSKELTSGDTLKLYLAEGGGAAISFVPLNK